MYFALYSFWVEEEHLKNALAEHTLDAFPDISVQGTVRITIIEGFKFHLGQFYRVFRPRYIIYFAISEISDTFALLNQKVYPSRALKAHQPGWRNR